MMSTRENIYLIAITSLRGSIQQGRRGTNIQQPEGELSATMPDINVTTEGIRKPLQKLNVNKASGPDMIPARILKELSEEIAPFLCTIYQKCLETGSIPDIWKTAIVSAIFKKGEVIIGLSP